MAAKHTPKELVELAHKHLCIYFSQLQKSGDLAIIERGEGRTAGIPWAARSGSRTSRFWSERICPVAC